MAIFLVWWLKDVETTKIVIFSLLVHEVGHWLLLAWWGIPSVMFFIPPLGAICYTPKRHRPAMSQLPYGALAAVLLAGPGANFILMGIGIVVGLNDGRWDPFWFRFAFLNAILCSYNLLPIWVWKLLSQDGSSFLDTIFASTNQAADALVAIFGILVSAVFMIPLFIVWREVAIFFAVSTVIGFVWKSFLDDPDEHLSPRAMTGSTVVAMLTMYVTLLFGSYGIAMFLLWTALSQ